MHGDFVPTAATIARYQALVANYQTDLTAMHRALEALSPIPAAAAGVPTVAQARKQAIADAVLQGAEKFTAIPVPTLAFFATEPKLPAALPAAVRTVLQLQGEAQARQADAFAAGVPTARVVRLPGAAHRVWTTDEAEVVQDMNSFMDGLH
jgi:hypothetical protein